LLHVNVTEHPTSEWTLQQLREALPGDQDYKFLLHDRHNTFSASLDETVESWGIHVLRSPVRMPIVNAYRERLIGIRRECADYVIPLNASHLRSTLREWVSHYNGGRPHRSSGPGIPDDLNQATAPRPTADQLRAASYVLATLILGGCITSIDRQRRRDIAQSNCCGPQVCRA
jgi:putative transposase